MAAKVLNMEDFQAVGYYLLLVKALPRHGNQAASMRLRTLTSRLTNRLARWRTLIRLSIAHKLGWGRSRQLLTSHPHLHFLCSSGSTPRTMRCRSINGPKNHVLFLPTYVLPNVDEFPSDAEVHYYCHPKSTLGR